MKHTSETFAINPRPPGWGRLLARASRAIRGYDLLEPGDQVLVAVSGGNDSLVLLDLLAERQRKIGRKLNLTLIAGHVPGSYGGKAIFPVILLREIVEAYGLKFSVSGSVLQEAVFSDCFNCAMARRKALFDLAERENCNKIALGHNSDDLVETALLNMFYQGRFSSMSARQKVLRGKLTLIRPLALVWKEAIDLYAGERFGKLPKFKCPGSNDSKRAFVKQLVKKLEKQNPKIKANILMAITNPKMEYLPVIKNKNPIAERD
ncbi:tRNA 2-thiocytidine biosynthesis protein TtcA [candidate division TA06 bacterium]|nr:tRNA 2-thiocytidine biosynthesis protein TtcA [candidate division TA06 bacterium]